MEEIRKQIALLKQEKEEDYKQYQAKMMHTSLEDRVRDGVTWYPVKFIRDYISTGERISIDIERTKHLTLKHTFQVGAVVGIFSGSEKKKMTINGVVSYLKDNVMRIVLNDITVPDWINQDKIGVNALFDDATYFEMNKALEKVAGAKHNRLAEIRDFFYGQSSISFEEKYAFEIPFLNQGQNEAFNKVAAAQDMALVHGPPGTGKTTTLVKCIKDTVKNEGQVLVCAPSNTAVDLLVEKLVDEEVNVIRIGHPARLTHHVIENSLDVKISKHRDFKQLRELRKQSEEYRNLAKKYKRNFGKSEREQRDHLFKEARSLKNQSRDLESYICDALLDEAAVIACTLTSANNSLIRDRIFKSLFIDEASQAIEAACWIPMDRVQRVIMSGDHYQLPPTIKSIKAAKDGLEHTLFAKGINAQKEGSIMLKTQYRMEDVIMGFSSDYFYNNRLKTDSSIKNRTNPYDAHLLFIDTAGAGFDEKVKKETLSTYNEEEANFLVDFIEKDLKDNLNAGIITPYKAQTEYINDKLLSSQLSLETITVNTVDAFQGQERDVVYISLVRSNPNGEIGFLKEYRRMNVAITRAKYRLVIIGDSSTLGNDDFYQNLLDYVQKRGKYASVYEFFEY